MRGRQAIRGSFSIRVTRNSVQALSSAGTIISWNIVDHEVGDSAIWDIGAPTKLTAPITGTYLVVANIAAESDSAGQISILKGGADIHSSTTPRFWTGSGSTSALVRMSKDESIECKVFPATNVNSIAEAGRHYLAMVLVSL